MDMIRGAQIAQAGLTDWRKLAQGLHARYLTADFGAGARFVTAVGEAGDAIGHHPRVSMGPAHVDLKLVTDDAIYRDDDDGTEYVIEWVTQQDVDLARRVTQIAADLGLAADPASVSDIELGLDTARSATIAPVWAALLTGDAEAQGRGRPATRSGTPPGGCRTCGSGTPWKVVPRVSGSTSRSTSRPRRPSSASPPPSPRVARSSTTAARLRWSSSRTRTATGGSSASTSPP
jgi:pterin-4a-carbinolamine dehydratase